MSLMASEVATLCVIQVTPPSSVRIKKPLSPPAQPRLLSRKKTVFNSCPGGATRAAIHPCCARAAAALARTVRAVKQHAKVVLFSNLMFIPRILVQSNPPRSWLHSTGGTIGDVLFLSLIHI